MTKRRQTIYGLSTLAFGAGTFTLAVLIPQRFEFARQHYARWYETADSITDMVNSAWFHDVLKPRSPTTIITQAVMLNHNEVRWRSRFKPENGTYYDGLATPEGR